MKDSAPWIQLISQVYITHFLTVQLCLLKGTYKKQKHLTQYISL